MLGAFVGSAIGCVLLTVVIALGILLVQDTAREEEAMERTATAEALITLATPTNEQANGDSTPVSVAGNSTRTPSPTRTPGTVTPFAFTNTPRPATVPSITDTPAPVGVRASETPGIVMETSGSLVYFADREGNFDIFRLDLPVRSERQISSHFLDDAYPAVSPDGDWIAFQSNRDGDFDIYIMEANGNNTRRLVQNSVTDRMPTWSPDGEWVTFVSDVRGDGNTDLMRVRRDGSDLEMVYSSGERISSPQWHPDGDAIVFTTGQANNAITWEIALLMLNTGRVTMLTDNHFKDWSPIFSPEGDRILYLTDGTGFSAIGEMEADGTNARVLYDGAGYESSAVYSPDGVYIAFTSDISGRDEVYLLTADGAQTQPLTTRGGTQAIWISGQ
jgi:Tol biopolymer transport system component